MKNQSVKMLTLLGCAAAMTTVTMAQQTPVPSNHNSAEASMPAMSADQMFLHKASEGGLLEVKLGQLANDKASSPDVKAFGQKMATDHSMLNEQMKPIAMKDGVKPRMMLDKKDQATYDELAAMSGTDFDKAYINDMVKDHHKDLRDFREDARTTMDPDLKQAAMQGAKVIAEHTRMVDQLAQQMGLPVPPRGAMSTPPVQ